MNRKYIIIALLLFSGCGQVGYIKSGADLVLLGTTDKTMSDHALSIVTNKDCSTSRILTEDDVCKSYHVKNVSKSFCVVPSCYPKTIKIKK